MNWPKELEEMRSVERARMLVEDTFMVSRRLLNSSGRAGAEAMKLLTDRLMESAKVIMASAFDPGVGSA